MTIATGHANSLLEVAGLLRNGADTTSAWPIERAIAALRSMLARPEIQDNDFILGHAASLLDVALRGKDAQATHLVAA